MAAGYSEETADAEAEVAAEEAEAEVAAEEAEAEVDAEEAKLFDVSEGHCELPSAEHYHVECVKNDKVNLWADSKKLAGAAGGRLATKREMRAKLEDGPLYKGDHWVAVEKTNGKKDWIQVGDSLGRTGWSHVKHYGYPKWGDGKDPHWPHPKH